MAFLFCMVHYSPSSIDIHSPGSGSGGSGGGLQGSSTAHAVNEQNASNTANNKVKNLFFIQPFCLFCFNNKRYYFHLQVFFNIYDTHYSYNANSRKISETDTTDNVTRYNWEIDK